MNMHSPLDADPSDMKPKDWVMILAKYRDPDAGRSVFELAVSIGPFVALWALAWWSMQVSYVLTLGISVLIALFLVRIFCIQHDCGHGSFFKSRMVSDWVGRGLGVLTVTPYDVWRRSHAIHHSGAGNLDRRGMGDIYTLTVEEYNARTPFGKFMYRLYRHPLVLFVIGPAYVFLVEARLPLGFMRDGWRYWMSAMGTNVALAAVLGTMYWFGGIMPLVLIFLPSTIVAGSLGVWLFYVQHQFEETHWDETPN